MPSCQALGEDSSTTSTALRGRMTRAVRDPGDTDTKHAIRTNTRAGDVSPLFPTETHNSETSAAFTTQNRTAHSQRAAMNICLSWQVSLV